MSRYGTSVPTSHIPAHPYHHAPYSQPYTSPPVGTTHQEIISIQGSSYYGPLPAVPKSLYGSNLESANNDAWGNAQGPGANRDYKKGTDYLRSLGSSMASLDLNQAGPSSQRHYENVYTEAQYEKPLPDLPLASRRPHIHNRPYTDPGENQQDAYESRPAWVANTYHEPNGATGTAELRPPKSFKPSPYLIIPHISPNRRRPKSDSYVPQHSGNSQKPPSTPPRKLLRSTRDVIDLTYSASSSSSTPSSPTRSSANVTPRSPARLRRNPPAERPSTNASPSSSLNKTAAAVRCAGYTRSGQPCKRLVKVAAPFLIDQATPLDSGTWASGGLSGLVDEEEQRGSGRYCKDHAGMICSAKGFYSREKPGIWIEFEGWLPPELGQQTQTLLRMAMESRLTAKESPGFIYAYELRDFQTPTTSFFKVGRTDNVPRRIGQWTNQCQSKTPTLRDIFPLSASRFLLYSPGHTSADPRRQGSVTRSFLPGALSAGTIQISSTQIESANGASGLGRENPAVKRWERLIHLELAEISASSRPIDWEKCRQKCIDCDAVHREVFPIARDEAEKGGGEGGYQVVVEVISRWERFVRYVCMGE